MLTAIALFTFTTAAATVTLAALAVIDSRRRRKHYDNQLAAQREIIRVLHNVAEFIKS